ncbi:uncharacterized protein LOC126980389 isoform X3 [Eriocheir sinensis]|nr:uncharacterized protein LOC126980389 isoform X3 [Eriocheir sinensis]
MMRGKSKDEVKRKHKHEVTPLIPGPGDERESRVGRIDWCHCKNCVRVQTEEECYCCHEDEEAWQRALGEGAGEERRPINCLVEHPFFTSVCLNPYALKALHSRDSKLFEDDEDAPSYQKYRLTAFRAFVEFFHGQLEEDVQGPVPACAAATIRGVFKEHPFILGLPGMTCLLPALVTCILFDLPSACPGLFDFPPACNLHTHHHHLSAPL